MSRFITFEGGEGSGKSTQAKALHEKLKKLGIQVVLTYEPGGTALGKKLGQWLKWGEAEEMTPLTELLLFNAARAQSVAEIITPGLENGGVVISDRYTDSTTAYQGYGRGLDLELVKSINHTATGGLTPDLTILLDLAIEDGFARKKAHQLDRFEQEDLEFHQRVRQGYLDLAAAAPDCWLVLDAALDKDEIARKIWQRVSPLLPGKEG